MDSRTPSSPRPRKPLAGSLGAVLLVAVVAEGLARVAASQGGWSAVPAWEYGIAAAALGAAAWALRGLLLAWLTSLQFAVAILVVLGLATVAGTVILQGAPDADLAKRYGPTLAGAISALGWNDLFHTPAFLTLLGLLAGSMVLLVIKRHAWRPPEWGNLFAHVGVAVVILGGLVGLLGGTKGFIDLQEGQTARQVAVRDRFGVPTGEKLPLAFGLKLDKFEIERRPPEYRLCLYRKEGTDYRLLSVLPASDVGKWATVPGGASRYRLAQVWPDHRELASLEPAPGGPPGLQLRTFKPDGSSLPVLLLAGKANRNVVGLDRGRTYVRFVWEFDPASSPVTTESRPEQHRISFASGPEAPREEIVVTPTPGATYPLGAGRWELKVLEYLPDFAMDTKTKRRYSKSSRPENPALRVSLKGPEGPAEERWLLVRPTGHGPGHGGAGDGDLSYAFQAAIVPAERDIVVVGKSSEVVLYSRGRLVSRGPLPTGEDPLAPGVDAYVERLLPAAVERRAHSSASTQWKRPAVELEIEEAGRTDKALLAAGKPVRLDEAHALVFDAKPDDIKAFRSRVTVQGGEGAGRSAVISVNHPLAHGGYWFYQSNFRKEDPTYSGILVVKDPGLPIVYFGFGMIAVGVIYIFYVKPRFDAPRPKEAA